MGYFVIKDGGMRPSGIPVNGSMLTPVGAFNY